MFRDNSVMNIGFSPEKLHCLSLPSIVAGVKGMEMSVLERQRLVQRWQEEQLLQMQQQQQPQNQSSFNQMNMLSFLSDQEQNFQGLNMDCGSSLVPADPSLSGLLSQPIKADPGVENRWIDYEMPKSGITVESNTACYGVNYAISRTASCPPLVAEQKLSGPAGKESFKRKAECNLTKVEEESRSKKSKECAEEEESKITEQNSNINNNQSNQKTSNANDDKKKREASGCTSKDNTKASEVQKPDYIHVRARRGQATDSHSLAERVRREKISERMKYLQDLVPGCNKITGKAGMLDEIINYVQSLQRQVEFLSMKLAAVNPRIDFSIDDLFAKEVLAACSTSMPTMGVSSDITPNYLQYNLMQQIDPICGPGLTMNQIDMGLRRAISAPVSIPENTIDPSCFNISNSLSWDGDLQHMYALEFQQGRSTSFPLQTFPGTIEPSNLKMEM